MLSVTGAGRSKKFLFALLTRLEEDKKRGMSQVTEEEGQVL